MAKKMVPPLEDEDFRAIGAVTVNFAALEGLLKFFVWAFIGPDQRTGQIVTTEYSFRKLRAVALGLVKHRVRDAAMVDKCSLLLTRIGSLEERRNQITHSSWSKNKTEKKLVRLKPKLHPSKGWDLTTEWLTVDEVNLVADQLGEAGAELMDLLAEIVPPGAGGPP